MQHSWVGEGVGGICLTDEEHLTRPPSFHELGRWEKREGEGLGVEKY